MAMIWKAKTWGGGSKAKDSSAIGSGVLDQGVVDGDGDGEGDVVEGDVIEGDVVEGDGEVSFYLTIHLHRFVSTSLLAIHSGSPTFPSSPSLSLSSQLPTYKHS